MVLKHWNESRDYVRAVVAGRPVLRARAAANRSRLSSQEFTAMSESIMIAFGSDDGVVLSNRFGQARQAVVITVQDGREIAREQRDKAYNREHTHHHGDHDHDHDHEPPTDKFAAIRDCQVLVTRSIGPHGAEYAAQLGMQLYTVRARTVDEALAGYLSGTLEHDPRRIA